MAADPLTSKGARIEREAWQRKAGRLYWAAYRKYAKAGAAGAPVLKALGQFAQDLRRYGQTRAKRYNRRVGGLGRK